MSDKTSDLPVDHAPSEPVTSEHNETVDFTLVDGKIRMAFRVMQKHLTMDVPTARDVAMHLLKAAFELEQMEEATRQPPPDKAA